MEPADPAVIPGKKMQRPSRAPPSSWNGDKTDTVSLRNVTLNYLLHARRSVVICCWVGRKQKYFQTSAKPNTEKETVKETVQDVPVILTVPEEFPDELPGLPPPRQYEWGMEEDEAFQTLKQKLCSTPILAFPEGTKNFVLYCDASHKGYGAVLMQWKRLRRHYLYGTKCIVYTDHKILQYILDQKELNMRTTIKRRWIGTLSDYDCEIRYPSLTDAMKEENVKAKNLRRLIKPIFETLSMNLIFEGPLVTVVWRKGL
ncbi:putative reverse transcriptase domain-containing protein [Tanacetum coccineum]|uniref:Reverse transcriptase domain-containing protein n=1 Tax=Tanacetum coccineum TaxID=301880 RepID=A0ABQ5B207_9ASTR